VLSLARVTAPAIVPVPTVKLTALLAAPPTVTTTDPVVAPVGTMVVMLSLPHTVGVADVPLNVMAPEDGPKEEPDTTTVVPTGPETGDMAVILGVTIDTFCVVTPPEFTAMRGVVIVLNPVAEMLSV